MATATPTELTDSQWGYIEPLLPARAKTSRPRAEYRKTVNGILWVLRTGARWADMPEKYGASSTCHERLQTWQGKGSKLMAVVDGEGIPLGLLVENANPAEIKLAEPTLATIRVRGDRGRPKSRPGELVADKGYDSDPFRRALRKRGIRPCIPLRKNRKARPGRKVDVAGYRERWHVERTFDWIESFRRLTTRFERLVKMYDGLLYLAAAIFCLRRLVSG